MQIPSQKCVYVSFSIGFSLIINHTGLTPIDLIQQHQRDALFSAVSSNSRNAKTNWPTLRNSQHNTRDCNRRPCYPSIGWRQKNCHRKRTALSHWAGQRRLLLLRVFQASIGGCQDSIARSERGGRQLCVSTCVFFQAGYLLLYTEHHTSHV